MAAREGAIVRNLTRLGIAAIVSIGSGAVLWAILQPGFSVDAGISAGAAAGLAAVVAAIGSVWAAQPPDKAALTAEARPVPPSTLKRVDDDFSDRVDDWTDIRAHVRAAASGNDIHASFLIYGAPGVGKSEFALYAASNFLAHFTHEIGRADIEVVARQVDFHAYEALARTDPEDGLRALLPNSADPRLAAMNSDQLSAEWRSWLDKKFLVLLLDNVKDEKQVSPFLPGGSQYILLITARSWLPGLSGKAVPYRLDVLPKSAAVELVRKMTNRPLGGEAGDQEEQQAIAGIVELCEYLPLAIRVAVLGMVDKPGVSFKQRLAQLQAAPDLLREIDAHAAAGGDGVVRAFESSYDQLPDSAKRLLRLLSLGPVPTVSQEAGAALADLPADETRATLRNLERVGLIADKKGGERYEMHDLIRRYARSLASKDDPAENDDAVNRLLDYYLDALVYIDSKLTRQPPPPSIESPIPPVRHGFGGGPGAITWARDELENLLACADHIVLRAEGDGHRSEKARCILFISAISGLLCNDGLWERSIALQTHAINAAERIQVPLAEANALSERALLYRLTARLDDAVIDLDRALLIYQEIADGAGETGKAHALNTYGVVLDQRRDRAAARERFSKALHIYRRLNDRLGEANVLHDQGMLEYFAKNDDEAERLLSQALTLYTATDHPLGLAHAYNNLARVQQRAGAKRAAAKNLESARSAYQELGNQLGEINVLVQLGAVLGGSHPLRAARALDEAMSKTTAIGNQIARVNALYELGELHRVWWRRKAALADWALALEVAREHGLQREEERVATALATDRDRTGFMARWKR